MELCYNNKMRELGYNQLVCDIFSNWENVKDEILVSERKSGSGNGTIHVFLGAADRELQKEFSSYYSAVESGQDPSTGAVKIKHYFLKSNVISMLGHLCQYCIDNKESIDEQIHPILSYLSTIPTNKGMMVTESLFKLSIGSNKLRPYFKQFDSNGVFSKIVRRLLLPNSAYKISLFKNGNNEYATLWLIGFGDLTDFEVDNRSSHFIFDAHKPLPLQQIFYGTPGSGKSFKVKNEILKGIGDDFIFRTTFHPDSDYATFVGCYKPKMDGDNIKYEFIPQAFTEAYVKAWQEPDKQVYLVIEEINRGNCAQIFGDLFQLLDRKGGVSEYPINADADLKQYLEKTLGSDNEGIANGKLKLPANLNIVATMNTSDQSLFPMDSAFKRRWSWECVPIDYNNEKSKEFTITIDGSKYNWPKFLEAVNMKIFGATDSEDKQMGNFFINGNVDERQFIDKVMFYLWNDICKEEYRTTNNFFRYYTDDKKTETKEFSFNELFGSDAKILLKGFMVFLEVDPEATDDSETTTD